MTESHRVVTRSTPGYVHMYAIGPARSQSAIAPTVSYPVPGSGNVDGHAASPDGCRLVYAVGDEVVCVARDGVEQWRLVLGRPGGRDIGSARTDCVFSQDGASVWVYSPDCMADRGDADRWIVVDAASGGVQAAVELDCAGAGGSQILHPDGVHVLLDVGEGQDGTRTYQGRLDGNGLAVQSFPWTDRCLTDVAPNGSAFITVDHGQEDVSIHAYPDGAVQLRLRVTAFGYDGDDAFFAWTGGYIDATTALVTLTGETDDEREWCRHFAVDVRTGEIRRSVDVPAPVTHEVQPLGDGSWLSTQEGGRLRRELY